jgi:biotin carboxyl carrier protein
MRYDIDLGGKVYRLELLRKEDGWECHLDGREVFVQAAEVGEGTLSLVVGGQSFEVRRAGGRGRPPHTIELFIRGKRYEVSVQDPRSWRGRRSAAQDEAGPQRLTASMPGKVVRVLASEGDTIVSGQGIAVVEAMKMQNEIRSPRAGVLKKLLAHEGMKVNAGELLAIVE